MDTATGNASRNWNRRVWLATTSSRAFSARSAIHTANATNPAMNTASTATARTVPDTIDWSRSATATHTSTAAPSVTAPAGIANHGPRRSVRCQVNANIPTASTTMVAPVSTAIDTSSPQPYAAVNPAACPNNDNMAIAALNDPPAANTTMVAPVSTAIDTSSPQPYAAVNPAACPNNDNMAIAAINDPAAANTAARRPGHGHHGASADTPTPALSLIHI